MKVPESAISQDLDDKLVHIDHKQEEIELSLTNQMAREAINQGLISSMEEPATTSLNDLILAIQGELSAVGLHGKAAGFDYRRTRDIINAVGPLFRKFGIFVTPSVQGHTQQLMDTASTASTVNEKLMHTSVLVEYTIRSQGEETITSITAGEALDASDHGTAKAMTKAWGRFLETTFCLATDETLDNEEDDHGKADDTELFDLIYRKISAAATHTDLDKVSKLFDERIAEGKLTKSRRGHLAEEITHRRTEIGEYRRWCSQRQKK